MRGNVMFDIDAFIDDTIANDGATHYADPGNDDRYVVGGIWTVRVPIDAIRHPATRAIIRRMHDNLHTLHADTFGSWIDGRYVYFDLGTTHDHLVTATTVGVEREEITIWDRESFPDQHCFREESPSEQCSSCGWLAAAHTGCDCD